MIIKRYDKTRKCFVYDIRLPNEHGKMQYFPFGHTSKTLAKEYQEKLRNQIKEWRAFPERKIKNATFSDFVSGHYFPDHVNSLKSKDDYMSICKKLVREFGEITMDAFEHQKAASYLTRRYNEVSVYMANREFTILKAIFGKAEDWCFRAKGTNPCKGIKLKKEEPRFRVLNTTEIEKLISECKKGSGEFILDKFIGLKTVENLCAVLTKYKFSADISGEPNSIEWLNGILLCPNLYDRFMEIQNHVKLSKRAKDIKRRFETTKDEADLIRLNRVLIEECFPTETPQMPKKAIGLTEKEAVELKDQIEVSLHCGARKSELLGIKISDINFETGMLKLFGKGGKTRFVPMNSKLIEILERRAGGRKKYIFGNDKVVQKNFRRAFDSACDRAGIEDARPHDLRRTFGTRCAMAGVPPKTLQKWMGHENIETTMKYYVQIPEQFEKEAIERLSHLRKNDSQGNS